MSDWKYDARYEEGRREHKRKEHRENFIICFVFFIVLFVLIGLGRLLQNLLFPDLAYQTWPFFSLAILILVIIVGPFLFDAIYGFYLDIKYREERSTRR